VVEVGSVGVGGCSGVVMIVGSLKEILRYYCREDIVVCRSCDVIAVFELM
jgi:hypothetical protein